MDYDVFNGDADGLCALHQLRLAEPRQATLITGVKRDIQLLQQVDAQVGDNVTVLDISLDKNREDLLRVLQQGASVQYFDHHYAGDIPDHPKLRARINTAPEVCTGLLVNGYLNNRFLPWAVVAAFGDNLNDSAERVARPLALPDSDLSRLKRLGVLLNYNGYGAALEDLYFPPAELYKRMQPYTDPIDFIENEDAYVTLDNGYEGDISHARALEPQSQSAQGAVFILPNAAWARRVSGVYGNELARQHTERAHALLTEKQNGGYLVSVRAPYVTKTGADELCRQFATGGGRQAAAGINHLPENDLQEFIDRFNQVFERN